MDWFSIPNWLSTSSLLCFTFMLYLHHDDVGSPVITNEEGQTGVCSMSHTILSHIHHHPSSYRQQFSMLLNAKHKIKCDASQVNQLTTLISNYVYRKHLITQVPRISRLSKQQFRIGRAHSTAGVTSRVCHKPSGVCLLRRFCFSKKKWLLVSQVLKKSNQPHQ